MKDAHAVMFSVTAPGAHALAWDRRHCRDLGAHKCSGNLGCRVEREAAKEWNRTASRRWSSLHRRATIAATRVYGRGSLWMLARVFEKQARGVLHVHPVFAYATPRQRAAARFYRDYIERFAHEYGFGYVGRKVRPQPARGAAAYLSAYFCAGKKDKLTLHESVTTPDMPRSIVHVSTRLTLGTGVTMRELRFRRFVWARYGYFVRLGGDMVDLARYLAEIEREIARELSADEKWPLLDEWHRRRCREASG